MRLVVFMTYGVGLSNWQADRIFDREVAIYKKYREGGNQVVVVSYGAKEVNRMSLESGVDQVLCNKYRLPHWLYALLLPYLYGIELQNADIYKTNQMRGASVALRCAKLFGKPLVVRQGYGLYEFLVRGGKWSGIKAKIAMKYEARCLKGADAIISTTSELQASCIARHRVESRKMFVVPNYVVPTIWSPAYAGRIIKDKLRFVYVGRFVPQKNLIAFVTAASGLPVELIFIGSGIEEVKIRREAVNCGVCHDILGRLSQPTIVDTFRRSDVFFLPSHYEGHPKALIEAMTLGIPVLVSDGPGVREFVEDGKSGLVVSTSVESLRSGIEKMISMKDVERLQLGANARAMAMSLYSLDTIYQEELRIMENTIKRGRTRNYP